MATMPGMIGSEFLRGPQMVLIGPNHHAVEGFLAFGLVRLFVDDGVGADAFDLALERAVDRGVVGGKLDHRVLVGADEGDVLGTDPCLRQAGYRQAG